MSFSIVTSKITGNPGKSGWAQVHEFIPDDPEKLSKRGHLVAVIATDTFKEEGGVSVGRELVTRLHEEYFGKKDVSAFNGLKGALAKLIEEFEEVGNIQISSAAIVGDAVYTAVGGGGEISVLRSGMLAKLLASKKGEVVSASGYPREEDILVLGTSKFFETFTGGALKAALEEKDPKEAAEYLGPRVHADNGKGNLGAAIVKFNPRKVVVEKPEFTKKRFTKIKNRYFKAKDKIFGGEERIYVKRPESGDVDVVQRRRVAASIGIILLMLLVVSIGFGISQRGKNEEKARYEPVLSEAKYEFEEALNLFGLDANRARKLFNQSKEKTDQLLAEGVTDPELVKLREDLETNIGKILGEYAQSAELFVDLSLISDGFSGEELAVSEDIIYVLDKDGKKIIKVLIDSKKSEAIAGPEQIDDTVGLAAYSDRVYVVEGEGIFEVGEEKRKVVENTFSPNILIYSYAANLYVLDQKESAVWRYTRGEDSFSSGANWFSEGVKPDLSKVISWTIDGAIWLLDNQARIFYYSLGNQLNFTASGVYPELTKPSAIYTNEELEGLYLLEPEQNRVVVLNKSGEFIAQYKSEEIRNAIGIAVSEKGKKIILLTGEKLYSLKIGHLED
ncbi:MAG: hypothetical protein ACC618_03335 [Patescibacteria group bacterium]